MEKIDASDSNQTVTKEDNSTQNDYIITINKKIRALKKKCQNIAYIEKRVANKEDINVDQKKLLESKEAIIKLLKEFELLRDSFVDIFNNEEKKKTVEKPAEKEKVAPVQVEAPELSKEAKTDTIRELISLFHTSQVFDRTRPDGAEARTKFFVEKDGKSELIKTDTDIDHIFYLLSSLFTNSIKTAVDITNKFLDGLEEDFGEGVSYKQLKSIVKELANSDAFLQHPSQTEPQQESPVQEQQEQQQQQEAIPTETKAPEQSSAEQTQQAQPQDVVGQDENVDTNTDDQGYQTKEPRGHRGRGRGRGRGSGGSFRGSPRGGRREYDNRDNRDNRDRDNRPRENRGSRDFDSRPPRGGNRGARGGQFQQQQQQPRA